MWVSAVSEGSQCSSWKPAEHDLHSKTATHFSVIRHHLIRQLWDRYKPVFAGEDIMKVSSTTCTSPADATAKGVAGSTPGLLSASPAVSQPCTKQSKQPSPWAGLQPWSWDKCCPFESWLEPRRSGFAYWMKWMGCFEMEGRSGGRNMPQQARQTKKKRDLHCGKGTSAVQQAVPQTMLLSTSLQKASLLSTHCSPLLQTPLQHLITVPCWSIACWSCCCWGKGHCMSLLSLQRESKWLQKMHRERQEKTQRARSTWETLNTVLAFSVCHSQGWNGQPALPARILPTQTGQRRAFN